MVLQGVDLPPRGSLKDIYLQKALIKQHEQQFDMFYGIVQTLIAVNSTGENSSKLFTDLQGLVAGMLNRFFPYNKKQQAPEEKTKQDFNVLKRFLKAGSYTIRKKE